MFTQDLVAEHTNHKSSAHKRHTNDSYNTTIEIFNPSFGMAMERQSSTFEKENKRTFLDEFLVYGPHLLLTIHIKNSLLI